TVPLPTGPAREAFAYSLHVAGTGPVRAWLPDGDSPARTAGLPDGAQIVAVDEHPVTTVAEVQAAVAAAFDGHRPVTIKWRGPDGGDGTTAVTPVDLPEPDLGGVSTPILRRVVHESL